MPNPENIKGKGNRFSSTNQPANPGRKPSLYNRIKKLIGTDANVELSKEDYYKLIGCLLERPISDLKKIADDSQTPIWIISIIRAVMKDAQEGRLNAIDALFDRLFGKASQPITGKNDGPIELKGSIPIHKWVEDRLND